MKTTKQAASDYAEITNLLTGIEEDEIERAFLKGAEFADRWIHINEEKPHDRSLVLFYVENKAFEITGHYSQDAKKWYFYDFSENEFYELSKNDKVIKWKPIK